MNNQVLDKITIIIPTFNRYHFLLRLLKFYNSYGFPTKILILDSSSDSLEQEEVKVLLTNKRISYQKFNPDILVSSKIAKGLEQVQTPYSVICADDDFIVPSAIKKSLLFMEKNPDYSVVQGFHCSRWLRKKRNGKIEFGWVPGYYHSKSITFDSPSERLKFHLANYNIATFYGVHRTDTLRFIFKEVIDTTSHGRLGEILLTALTLICGKMKILPIFYASRESRYSSVERNYNPLPYFFLPWSSFLAGDTYKTEYRRAVVCLARNLQKQIDLDSDLSTKLAEDALNGYLDSLRLGPLQKIRGGLFNLLSKTLNESHLRKLIPHLRKLIHRYERMNNIITNIRLRGVKREYSDFLEKNDSKFHENLNRIRKAVTASKVYIIK